MHEIDDAYLRRLEMRSARLYSFEAYGLIGVTQWLDKCDDVTKLKEERDILDEEYRKVTNERDSLRGMNAANELVIAELHRKIGKFENAFNPYPFEPEKVEWKNHQAPEVDFERAWRLKYVPEGSDEDLCQSCECEQTCCLDKRQSDAVSHCSWYRAYDTNTEDFSSTGLTLAGWNSFLGGVFTAGDPRRRK
jgi:hypothetical protein